MGTSITQRRSMSIRAGTILRRRTSMGRIPMRHIAMKMGLLRVTHTFTGDRCV